MTDPACPSCQRAELVPHCDSATCTWRRCRQCRAVIRNDMTYGIDGKQKPIEMGDEG